MNRRLQYYNADGFRGRELFFGGRFPPSVQWITRGVATSKFYYLLNPPFGNGTFQFRPSIIKGPARKSDIADVRK